MPPLAPPHLHPTLGLLSDAHFLTRDSPADGTDVQNPALIPGLVVGGVAAMCLTLGLLVWGLRMRRVR